MHFILRTESFAKLFFLISCTGLIMYTILAFYTFHTRYSNIFLLQSYQRHIQGLPVEKIGMQGNHYNKDLKYILIWTIFNNTVNYYGEGLYPFVENKCPSMNCYLTTDKYLLNANINNFNAIVFKSDVLKQWKKNMPTARSPHQHYIFYGTESSDDAPVCNIAADDYFNWTCSYRIDSDIVAPFIEVKDAKENNFVAPKDEVNWESTMVQLSKEETKHLRRKRFAMAWIVNRCQTRNNRLTFAKKLQYIFKQNYLVFDIYGCGFLECPKGGCLKAIDDYYFYFAAEDSNAEDYVTTEVINAYNYNAIPVVFGGADYHKFLPDGSYINAGSTSIDKLAALIDYIIRNPKVYESYYRWKRHYTISAVNSFAAFCKICEYLNENNEYRTSRHKKHFRTWWYGKGPLFDRCFPKSAENYAFILSYANTSNSKQK